MLKGKCILIGITGGIAAYKICELIRMYKKNRANVKVICTPNAMNFVTKLTLQNLSQNEVYIDEFTPKEWKPESQRDSHIQCSPFLSEKTESRGLMGQ